LPLAAQARDSANAQETLMNFILWLLAGALVAGVAALLRGRTGRQRLAVDTGFAVAGALLGGACAAALDLGSAGAAWPGVLAAALGALLLAVGNLHVVRSRRP
jgi:uncharacterized membrane protein YeaQ/YmgE (transglycosylase-associated protein family)